MRWKAGRLVKKASADRVIKQSELGGWKRYEVGNEKGESILTFQFQFTNQDTLQLEFQEREALPQTVDQHSRIRVNFKSDDSDSYFGMGMRFNQCNHKGTVVTNWCREVGPNLPLVAKKGTAEGRDTTYAPVPFFVNFKGYGLLLRSLHYSTFDFGSKDKNRFAIENNTSDLKLELFFGERPLDVVSSYYQQTGRYKKPKPWVFGVWAAASADWQSKTIGEVVSG